MENKPKLIDLFCGAGGLSLGFEMAGFDVLAGIEIDSEFLKTYKNSHKNTLDILGDINRIDLIEHLKEKNIDISHMDLVIGGPPCQGFSTVGNRMIDDERNLLVKEFVRIVSNINPKMFVMENVSGLSSMRNGLGDLIKDELFQLFDDIGYNTSSKVLLATDYGVPQLRKRIFFVGMRKDFEYNFQFPKPSHFANNTLFASKDSSYLTVHDAISDLPPIKCNEFSDTYLSEPLNEYQKNLREGCVKLLNHKAPKHSNIVLDRIKNIPQGGNHSDLPENLKLKRGYSNIYGKLHEKKPADTITGNCGCASAPGKFIHPNALRVLTVREASRLQSFPDYVEFFGSVSKQYKQVGNAVPPLLAKSLALEVKRSIEPIK